MVIEDSENVIAGARAAAGAAGGGEIYTTRGGRLH